MLNELSQGKQIDAEEFTTFKWEHSASHLVAYQILKFFKDNRSAAGDKKDDDDKVHPLMDPRLSNIGISYKGHKKVENII